MAYIKKVIHARKQHTCQKCGGIINIGDTYMTGKKFRKTPIHRCMKCGLYDYELSDSEWVNKIGTIVNEWDKQYRPIEAIESIINDLENLRSTLEDNFENIPEQFKDTAETALLIQDRCEMIDSCIEGLSAIDYEGIFENCYSDAVEVIQDECDTIDFKVEEWEKEILHAQSVIANDKIQEEIDTALEILEY